jgi:hypothetical protein
MVTRSQLTKISRPNRPAEIATVPTAINLGRIPETKGALKTALRVIETRPIQEIRPLASKTNSMAVPDRTQPRQLVKKAGRTPPTLNNLRIRNKLVPTRPSLLTSKDNSRN